MKWKGEDDMERKAEKQKRVPIIKKTEFHAYFLSQKISLKHSSHKNGG